MYKGDIFSPKKWHINHNCHCSVHHQHICGMIDQIIKDSHATLQTNNVCFNGYKIGSPVSSITFTTHVTERWATIPGTQMSLSSKYL